MLVRPVSCVSLAEPPLSLSDRFRTSLKAKHDALACGYSLTDERTQFLDGNPHGADQAMRDKFNELRADQMALDIFIAEDSAVICPASRVIFEEYPDI